MDGAAATAGADSRCARRIPPRHLSGERTLAAIAPEIRIAGSRALAAARYENDATAAELVLSGYVALMRWITDSRLPKNLAMDILMLAECDIEDTLYEESVSWAETPEDAKCFGLQRAFEGD